MTKSLNNNFNNKDGWKLFGNLFSKKKILLDFRKRVTLNQEMRKRVSWMEEGYNKDDHHFYDDRDELPSYRELLKTFKREKESYVLIRKHLRERLLMIRRLNIPRDDVRFKGFAYGI
jgi:hypothetical protein